MGLPPGRATRPILKLIWAILSTLSMNRMMNDVHATCNTVFMTTARSAEISRLKQFKKFKIVRALSLHFSIRPHLHNFRESVTIYYTSFHATIRTTHARDRKLAFHDTDTDILARNDEGMSASVSWNASFTKPTWAAPAPLVNRSLITSDHVIRERCWRIHWRICWHGTTVQLGATSHECCVSSTQ